MNVKEFRVGSLFILKGEVVEFDSHKAWNIHDLEPVPLTKKWLLKMGFLDLVDPNETIYIHLELRCCHYNLEDNSFNFYQYNDEFDQEPGLKVENVKYVHQIQNIFYDLKSEELKIS